MPERGGAKEIRYAIKITVKMEQNHEGFIAHPKHFNRETE
jgi:hypothetical protein